MDRPVLPTSCVCRYHSSMRIYLDLCAWKRAYDRPTTDQVVLEAMAIAAILQAFEQGKVQVVSSAMLQLENSKNPVEERRSEVADLLREIPCTQEADPGVIDRGREFAAAGVRPLDALHLASAERADCDLLVTCDHRFVKAAVGKAGSTRVKVVDPLEAVRVLRSMEEP